VNGVGTLTPPAQKVRITLLSCCCGPRPWTLSTPLDLSTYVSCHFFWVRVHCTLCSVQSGTTCHLAHIKIPLLPYPSFSGMHGQPLDVTDQRCAQRFKNASPAPPTPVSHSIRYVMHNTTNMHKRSTLAPGKVPFGSSFSCETESGTAKQWFQTDFVSYTWCLDMQGLKTSLERYHVA